MMLLFKIFMHTEVIQRKWLFLGGFFLLLSSTCSEQTLKPKANYLPGEILVVCDSSYWSEDLGRHIENVLQVPLEGLPQPEPHFVSIKLLPSSFQGYVERSAGVLMVCTDTTTQENRKLQQYFQSYLRSDTSSLHFFRDIYAKGQYVILLTGSAQHLHQLLDQKAPLIREYFDQMERTHLQKRLYTIRNQSLMNELQQQRGFSLLIPKYYAEARATENFVWWRSLHRTYEKNIFVHYEPYNKDTLSFESLAPYRERITKRYLYDKEKPHLYITQQTEVELTQHWVRFAQNFYALRSTGLWRLSDYSIGGGFISYAWVDTTTQLIYYIEGFFYRPGEQKRDLRKEVDAILWTFKIQP